MSVLKDHKSATIKLLITKLISNKKFWSFDMDKSTVIPDTVLIEKTLTYLDIEDIDLLFSIYPKSKIKNVWRNQMALQGEFYGRLNRFLAWMYFDIKNPDRYLKTIENRHFKYEQ